MRDLKEKVITYVPHIRFTASRILGQSIYITQFNLGKSIYGTTWRCGFIVYHSEKHPECLVIESKWQQSAGSVDKKYPYFVLNIKK